MSKQHILEGKTITGINIAADREAIQFIIEGGDPIIARCDADCCSRTFVESIELPALGFPATVIKASDLDMGKEDLSNDEYECLDNIIGNVLSRYEGTISFFSVGFQISKF